MDVINATHFGGMAATEWVLETDPAELPDDAIVPDETPPNPPDDIKTDPVPEDDPTTSPVDPEEGN